MADSATMLDNLLAGFSARGAPLLHEAGRVKAITFTKVRAIREETIAALDLSARIFGGITDENEEHFTHFARKMIFHARQGGTLADNPNFLTRAGHAARAALANPQILLTGIGFPALVTKALENDAMKKRLASRPISIDDEIAEMRAKALPPDLQPCWQDAHGLYQLFEFTHPFHVWEEGLRLNNCIARIFPYNAKTRVPSTADPALLQDLLYWKEIENNSIDLFSLRSGTARIALLRIRQGALIELSLQYPNEPSLWELLAEASEYIDARYGEFRISIARPLLPLQAVIENLRYERMKRSKRKQQHNHSDLPANRPARQRRRGDADSQKGSP
jgi:hypothetical protein